MTPNVERGRRVTAWLGVAFLGLLPVSFLSAQDPKLRATLKGHTNAVESVAFSPDGKTLGSASGDKTVRLWDLAINKERAILRGHTESVMSVAFSPDGRMLASAGGSIANAPGELMVWESRWAGRQNLGVDPSGGSGRNQNGASLGRRRVTPVVKPLKSHAPR